MIKGKKILKVIEKAHYVFLVFIFLVFFVIAPVLLYQEYKTNTAFAKSLTCEEEIYENHCTDFRNISTKSNHFVSLVILYWFFLIFFKDIYPNRHKIHKFMKKYFDFDDT